MSFDKYIETSKLNEYKKEANKILSDLLEGDLGIEALNKLYVNKQVPESKPGKVNNALAPIPQPPTQIGTNAVISGPPRIATRLPLEQTQIDEPLDQLKPLKDPNVDVLQGTNGEVVIASKQPVNVKFAKKEPVKTAEQLANESYDYLLSSLIEEDDVIVPVAIAPKEVKKELEKTKENEDEDEEEDKKEDKKEDEAEIIMIIPELSPEELVQIRGASVNSPLMREPSLGSVYPVSMNKALPPEQDTIGTSVAGLDMDLALKFL